MLKKIFAFLLLIFLFSCSNKSNNTYIEAKVNKILSSITFESQDSEEKIKEVTFELITSINETIIIKQKFYPYPKKLKEPTEGDRVILAEVVTNDGELNLQIVDYKRVQVVYISILLFIIIILIWGKIRALFFIGIMLFTFLLYKVIYLSITILNPLFTSFIFCLFLSLIINFLMYRKKEIIRNFLLSNTLSMLFVVIISYFFSKYAYFDSILFNENNINSNNINSNININFLISSSILISSFGIIIYSCINSFNSYSELIKLYPKKTKNQILTLSLKNTKPGLFLNILKIYLLYLGLSLPLIIKNNNLNIINVDVIAFYIISFCIFSISSLISSTSIIYLSYITKK
ncbi:MAG: hypothetical protein KatS3mg068_0099 [Candidatus Sericytochromatia bacterium]|nr:MAG: hypothetical protein KatS3mg068_0099 [Candidatus Sericytochromatia bacterium]